MKRSHIFQALSLFTLAILTVILTAMASSAQAPVKAPITAKETIQKTGPAAGLLYKISGNGLAKPSYIFGTIHIICEADMFPMDKLNSYLTGSDQIILELDMDDPNVMQAMAAAAALPPGKTFTEFLTPEEYAKVDEMFKTHMGVSVAAVKTFKPFILQAMLATLPKVIGCAAPASYEISFVKTAEANKKPIEGLETVDFQIAALDKTPLEKQARDLYKMAQDPQKAFDQFKTLLNTYKLQDSGKLYDELNRQMEADRDAQARLIDERNKVWAPKLETMMKTKSLFIAVGGGHLGGKNGVLELLKTKGYKIEAIKL